MAKQARANDLRDLLLLRELAVAENVSQRTLARRLGLGLGVVNRRVKELLEEGYIRVRNPAVRPFAYILTRRGKEYRTRLRHRHYQGVVGELKELQSHIEKHLRDLERQALRRVAFYPAGEVMELTLQLTENLGVELDVVGIVDDDPRMKGVVKGTMVVRSPDALLAMEPDVVLITTFRHAEEIRNKIPMKVRSAMRIREL